MMMLQQAAASVAALQQNLSQCSNNPSDKSFVCEICGKGFRFRSNLAEHRSVHTAIKPFVCKFCGKSSRLKGNLTKHILKHHRNEHKELLCAEDILTKKGKKSVKDPAAIEFIEKSMIILPHPPNSVYDPNNPSNESEMNGNDSDREQSISSDQQQFFLSLGLDAGSLDLKAEKADESLSLENDAEVLDELIRNNSASEQHLLSNCNLTMLESTADQEILEFAGVEDQDTEGGHQLSDLPSDRCQFNQFISAGSTAFTIAAKALLLSSQQSKLTNGRAFGQAKQQQEQCRFSNGGSESVEGYSMDSSAEGDNEWDTLSPLIGGGGGGLHQQRTHTGGGGGQPGTAVSMVAEDELGFSPNKNFVCGNNNNNKSNGVLDSPAACSKSGSAGGPIRTQCPKCGKHMRKPRDLVAHLAAIHKISPAQQHQMPRKSPSPLAPTKSLALQQSNNNNNDILAAVAKSVAASLRQQQQNSNCSNHASTAATIDANGQAAAKSASVGQHPSNNIASELRGVKTLLNEVRGHQKNGQKLDQLVTNLDLRMGRLEKQLEMALNSIYTLVQLQTGINNSLKQFEDHVGKVLKSYI